MKQDRRIAAVAAALALALGAEVNLAAQFVNPIAEGADPWVVRHGDAYYWCQSEGGRGVAVWKSERLTDLGEKHVVWRAPKSGPHRAQIWAPELHQIDGRWYIYTAASDGRNESHRAIVLQSEGADPLGPYELKGELYTGDDFKGGKNNRWAIDATPLEHEGRLYAIWSGWEGDADEQDLYIAPLENPWTAAGPRVKLCANDDYTWERVSESKNERGLVEAPQVLKHKGRVFVVYSCSGSWEPSYKLGMLELRSGGDPLKAADWSKRPAPVFSPTKEVFGIGHCSFTKSPDGSEDWLIYHAKRDRAPGWQRAICVQPFGWTDDGEPDFGKPVEWAKPLPVPSGQQSRALSGAIRDSFDDGLARWAYYGHHQFLRRDDERIHLGKAPKDPTNDFRTGEKLVVRDGDWRNLTVRATVCLLEGQQDAGLLFRTSDCSLGYDAQKGYFAGIIPAHNRIILGATDGVRWHELARSDHELEFGKAYDLEVVAEDDLLTISLDGEVVLQHRDNRYTHGTAGLRVVNSHAWFDDFEVQPVALQQTVQQQ